MDFEEEEEEEEGNEEGWVLEPQEGGVGSMEGPDDSEVTFALHSGKVSEEIHHKLRPGGHSSIASVQRELLALVWRNSGVGGSVMAWPRAWPLESAEKPVFQSYLGSFPTYDHY